MNIKYQNYLEVFYHQSQVDRYYAGDRVHIVDDGTGYTGVILGYCDTGLMLQTASDECITISFKDITSIRKRDKL